MRKKKRRSSNLRMTGMNIAAIAVIIGMAVLAGFLTTRFVIYPLFIEQEETDKVQVTEQKEVPVQNDKNGFCIQFGSFSTRESAEELVSKLLDSGIKTEIIEENGTFRVTGIPFDTKEEAASEKTKLVMQNAEMYEDIFITERERT